MPQKKHDEKRQSGRDDMNEPRGEEECTGPSDIYLDGTGSVLEHELKVVKRRRLRVLKEDFKVASLKASPRHSLTGLGLSGGGIRSALFNLGVLQELSRLGLLRILDFLSTVSGGGYIGGCLSGLLSIKAPPQDGHDKDGVICGEDVYTFHPGEKPLFSTKWNGFPFREYPLKEGPGECSRKKRAVRQGTCGDFTSLFSPRQQMQHLRRHSNYLLPGGSNPFPIFRSLGALSLNFLATFSWFTTLVLMAVTIYMGLVHLKMSA